MKHVFLFSNKIGGGSTKRSLLSVNNQEEGGLSSTKVLDFLQYKTTTVVYSSSTTNSNVLRVLLVLESRMKNGTDRKTPCTYTAPASGWHSTQRTRMSLGRCRSMQHCSAASKTVHALPHEHGSLLDNTYTKNILFWSVSNPGSRIPDPEPLVKLSEPLTVTPNRHLLRRLCCLTNSVVRKRREERGKRKERQRTRRGERTAGKREAWSGVVISRIARRATAATVGQSSMSMSP